MLRLIEHRNGKQSVYSEFSFLAYMADKKCAPYSMNYYQPMGTIAASNVHKKKKKNTNVCNKSKKGLGSNNIGRWREYYVKSERTID